MYEIGVDFSELAKHYAGRWVALDPDTHAVVSTGDSVEQVLVAANERGIDEPLITYVVENYTAFVPCIA